MGMALTSKKVRQNFNENAKVVGWHVKDIHVYVVCIAMAMTEQYIYVSYVYHDAT